MDRRLTYSQIRTANACMYKHYLAYCLGLRKDDTAKALRVGRVFHEGLDNKARGLEDTEAIREALRDYDKNAPLAGTPEYSEWEYERETASALLAGYFWRWQHDMQEVEVVASESSFILPLRNPNTGRSSRTFTLAGKIDKIVKFSDGTLALMEHKTTSCDIAPESDYWKRLRLDRQISMYLLAAREHGYQIDSIIYDVVRKPTIGPKILTQGETNRLMDDGEYFTKLPGKEEPEFIGDFSAAMVDDSHVSINGKVIDIISGKKGFAIRESPEMFSARLCMDMWNRPDYYFARRLQTRTEDELFRVQSELWHMAKNLRNAQRNDAWIRNDDACVGFGTCPYFDLCANDWTLGMGTPQGYVQVEDVHQELATA